MAYLFESLIGYQRLLMGDKWEMLYSCWTLILISLNSHGLSVRVIDWLDFYSPALKKWGLYWICLVLLSFCDSVNFSSHFSQELLGLEHWNLVHTWTVGRCIMYTRIRLLLICPFIPSFFFLSNFQTLKFFVTLSQELWGLEDWNLVHMWTVGIKIVCTRIRLLLWVHTAKGVNTKTGCISYFCV